MTGPPPGIRAVWKGRLPYAEAHAAQLARRDALIAGRVDEELWLLEHDPVITTGRRTVEDLDATRIAETGYALVATERGGLATAHEPGQLVGYLLVDARSIGARRTVAAVEDGLITWLRGRGVLAERRAGYPGVWVGTDKIAAIGLHFREGRTLHGFALNLVNDLRGFSLVTPCGITDGGVVRLADLGDRITPAEAAPSVGHAVIVALLDARGTSTYTGGSVGT